jgi:hypothetical protein
VEDTVELLFFVEVEAVVVVDLQLLLVGDTIFWIVIQVVVVVVVVVVGVVIVGL